MDVNMPEMDGYEATRMLRDECPEVRVIALSMLNSESTLIRMIRAGAKSFVPKDASAEELDEALKGVMMKGYHYSQFVSSHLLTSLSMRGNESANSSEQGFSTRELEFLKLACSELTYRQIADKMFLSHRSIDGYRDALFHKLGLKSRVGLAVYAIREGLVEV
jgi:DNA-binding NarL/FixJ family response regulator